MFLTHDKSKNFNVLKRNEFIDRLNIEGASTKTFSQQDLYYVWTQPNLFWHMFQPKHLAGSYSDFICGSHPNHCVFQRPRCCPMAVVALPAGAELPVFLGGWRSLRFFP